MPYDPISMGQSLQGKTAGSGGVFGTGVSPSGAINAGMFGLSMIPGGSIPAAIGNAGIGFANGARNLTSQQPSGIGGWLNPTNPGMIQQGANWLGRQLLGRSPMSFSQGTAGNPQMMGQPQQSDYNRGMVNITPGADPGLMSIGNGANTGGVGSQQFGSQVAQGFGNGWSVMSNPTGAYNGTLFGGSPPDGRPKYAL